MNETVLAPAVRVVGGSFVEREKRVNLRRAKNCFARTNTGFILQVIYLLVAVFSLYCKFYSSNGSGTEAFPNTILDNASQTGKSLFDTGRCYDGSNSTQCRVSQFGKYIC